MGFLRMGLSPEVLRVIESVDTMPAVGSRNEKLLHAISLHTRTNSNLEKVFNKLIDGIYGNDVILSISLFSVYFVGIPIDYEPVLPQGDIDAIIAELASNLEKVFNKLIDGIYGNDVILSISLFSVYFVGIPIDYKPALPQGDIDAIIAKLA
jgi:hypothetical protein